MPLFSDVTPRSAPTRPDLAPDGGPDPTPVAGGEETLLPRPPRVRPVPGSQSPAPSFSVTPTGSPVNRWSTSSVGSPPAQPPPPSSGGPPPDPSADSGATTLRRHPGRVGPSLLPHLGTGRGRRHRELGRVLRLDGSPWYADRLVSGRAQWDSRLFRS